MTDRTFLYWTIGAKEHGLNNLKKLRGEHLTIGVNFDSLQIKGFT